MRRFIGVAIVLASALGWPAHAEVLIGVAGALTGQLAWTGSQIQRGAEMAVADINAAGGVLGQQIKIIVADDVCDPEQAVVAARKLVADGVALVIGHGCSGASIPASKEYAAAGVLQISPASTNPQLTEQGRANVFRTIGRDDQQGIVAGDYLADHWGDRKIAILSDGTTYGKGLAEATRKQLSRRGMSETVNREYEAGKTDYSAEIAVLKAADIAVLYVGGYWTDIALLARTARDRNYRIQVISGDTLATEEYGLIAGPAAEGTLFTFPADPRRNAEAASVVKRFRAENFEPDSYTLLSYAAVEAWSQAVEKAGSLALKSVIAALHDHEFDTVLGRIDFDDKGDLTAQRWIWYVWKGGEYVLLQ